jgi:hypothetical protein
MTEHKKPENRTGPCTGCGRQIDALLAPELVVVDDQVLPFCSVACRHRWEEALQQETCGGDDKAFDGSAAMGTVTSAPARATFGAFSATRWKWIGAAVFLVVIFGSIAVVLALRFRAQTQRSSHKRPVLRSERGKRPSQRGRKSAQSKGVDQQRSEVSAQGDPAEAGGHGAAAPTPRYASKERPDPRLRAVVPDAENFRFVIWPDIHVQPGHRGLERPVRKALAVTIEKIRPSFVLHTGDSISIRQVRRQTNDSRVWSMWRKFDRQILAKLQAARILFFPSPGNHDIHNAQAIYKKHWARHRNYEYPIDGPDGYGSYYAFDFGSAHFVSLAAPGSRRLADGDAQRKWLARDLAQARKNGAKIIFVFSHSPVFCPQMNTRCEHDMLWLREPKMLELFRKYHVVHIGGHMHVFHDTVFAGVRTLIGGMLGGGRRVLSTRQHAQPFQFLVVDVVGQRWKLYRVRFPEMSVAHLPPLERPQIIAASRRTASDAVKTAASQIQ